MQQNSPYLFVYGTLLNGSNHYGAYLQQHCSLWQPGKLKGLLYDLGEYPGALLDEYSQQYIYGQIYQMDSPERILKVIDDYEGFGPEQEQPNLFVRVMAMIETETGPVDCWVYIYNLPVDGAILIAEGRYIQK